MKVWKLLWSFVPTYRSFARFTLAMGLGIIFAAVAGAKLGHFFAGLPAAFDSRQGNWFPDRFERSGILKYDPARAYSGYTLYTVAPDLSAHLIDMNGREIHKWFVPFDVAVPGSSRSITSLFGLAVRQIEGGYLYPNGDILLVYEVRTVGRPGTPLVKLDKDSHVIWRSKVGAHHAIQVVGDKIYALTGERQRPQQDRRTQTRNRRVPYSGEHVSILDSNGNTLSTHSIMEAIANTDDIRLVEAVRSSARQGGEQDLHSNSIDVLTDQTARFIPGAKPGNVLLSLRSLDMLVVMDLEAEKIVWALRGSWRKQHDAKMLPNGHILLFDNSGDLITEHGRSRVLEIDPRTGGIAWSYDGTNSDPLDSSENRGGAQRLSNGNTLINEANAGRILEVTGDHKVVWEFVNPDQKVLRGSKYIASFGLNVTRYDPSYVKFLNLDKNHVAKQ
ncbi:MAG: arylsulfotransferase family protein [Chloroflexota bacterium]